MSERFSELYSQLEGKQGGGAGSFDDRGPYGQEVYESRRIVHQAQFEPIRKKGDLFSDSDWK